MEKSKLRKIIVTILIIAVVLSILFLKEARKKNPIITLELSVVLAIS